MPSHYETGLLPTILARRLLSQFKTKRMSGALETVVGLKAGRQHAFDPNTEHGRQALLSRP